MPFRTREEHRAWEREYSKRDRQARPEYYLWKSAKKRARDKGLDFDLEVSDIIIPNFCPYLGIEIRHETGKGSRNPYSPSLDRIDSSKGYIKGNIIVCSWRANFLKSDATFDELVLIVKQWSQLQLHNPENQPGINI